MIQQPADSFIWYRLPNHQKVVRLSGILTRANEFSPDDLPCFVVAPFHEPGKEMYWMKLVPRHLVKTPVDFTFLPQIPGAEGREPYLNLVSKAKSEIQSGAFQKLVLANRHLHSGPDSPIDLFEKLEENYPGAFVYLLSSPKTGTWIGASPEPLLIQSRDLFETAAIAGTRSIESTETFGTKEQEEQEWVAKFIEAKLNGEGIAFSKSGPDEYSTGNLKHLRTRYTFQHPTDWMQLAPLLHPTPAVSGLPQKASVDFLVREEGFPRELYSGYLGPVATGYAHLYVNLRCLQWHPNGVSLYAGAGITADSVPEKEWQETQNKMGTLEKYLN